MSSVSAREFAPDHALDPAARDVPPIGTVCVAARSDLSGLPFWRGAFAHLRKDSRYYEIVEDTICPEFQYRYFAIKDAAGEVCAIQPFLILDQDLVAGAGGQLTAIVCRVRRLWPRFLVMKTLMVGCAAGEGHLHAPDLKGRLRDAQILSAGIVRLAKQQKASLIVLKEFPAEYRTVLSCFLKRGFACIPSMPMTRLNIAYRSFEDYMTKALKSSTRAKLRKKFRVATQADPISLEVVSDASQVVKEIYPLYLSVFGRSKLQFEKLTEAYFAEIGRRMPDKARFFLWRQNGKLIAFALCLLEGETLYGEYVGLDYDIALEMHLYFYVTRDLITWGIDNGFKSFAGSGLSYAPKLQMRHVLEPLDLYVRHTSPLANAVLKRVLPWLEPTHRDETLRQFPNYDELWPHPRRGQKVLGL